MVTMWAAALWAATAGLAPGLAVETGSPDALCPELSATRAAVEARLGVVGVEGRAGWTARYTMWHLPDRDSDFVRLEVTDPGGVRRLSRDLPLTDASCSTMASVIALVLDRYFRDLLGSGAPTASHPVTVAAVSAKPPAQPRPVRHVVLGLAAGAVMLPASPGVVVDFALEAGQVRLGLQSGWSTYAATESLGQGGSARLTTSVPLRLSLGWLHRFGRVSLYAGPELFSAYERARADGIAIADRNSRLALGAGGQAGIAIDLGRGVRITAETGVDRVLGGGKLTVDSVEVLPLRTRAIAGIGIAYAKDPEGS